MLSIAECNILQSGLANAAYTIVIQVLVSWDGAVPLMIGCGLLLSAVSNSTNNI